MNILAQLKGLIKKATQTLVVDDSGDFQTAQVAYLGQTQTVRQITQYGLYSSSPLGSEWVIWNLRANPNDKVGIGNDYANRPKDLKEGEVVLYNIKTEKYIKLDENGDMLISATNANITIEETIEINAKNIDGTIDEEITLSFDKADLTGDIDVTGDIDITGEISSTGNISSSLDISGLTVTAGNGATGIFTNSVTVLNGIVTGGS